MISLKNIVKKYENEAGVYNVLKQVSLEIAPGEYAVIMGRSGSGKSTLLNILTGIDKPTSGDIVVNNTSIKAFNESKMAEWRGDNIGIVFQFFQLIPTLSVLENLLLPMDLVKKIPAAKRKQRAMELLEKVGLAKHANKMPHALSGGEQQRVAIARALANDAPLLIADEPTGNLDSANAEAIFKLFKNLNKEGKTIIMVTHEREMIEGATRKIIMRDGKIVEDALGSLEEKAV